MLIFLVLLATNAFACNSSDPSPYLAAFLPNWDALARGMGLLSVEETLFPVSYGGDPQAWLYTTQYEGIDARKNAQARQCGPGPDIGGSQQDRYMNWLLTSFDVDGASSEAVNCWLAAQEAITWWKNSSTSPYYLSLTTSEWAVNFDAGQYRKPVSWSVSHVGVGAAFQMDFKADSLMRVDVQAREWFVPSVPFGLRTSRVSNSGLCPPHTRLGDCFFDQQQGLLNQWTTGFLVTSNCISQWRSLHLNSTMTCVADIPFIAAWIVRPLPIHAAFCPCAKALPPKSATHCIPRNNLWS
jgi:hypothetical protein